MKTVCYIALGSNTDREFHIHRAQEALNKVFPDIRFAPALETAPIGMKHSRDFLNQVACISTEKSKEEVKELLKALERKCADVPKDKEHELIRIDLDLLSYGEQILKMEDWKRDYVQEGIRMLQLI